MLLQLWLPILLSGGVAFSASFAAWMLLPHHKKDWAKLRDEEDFKKTVGEMNIAPGQYMFPCQESSDEMKSEEFKQRWKTGPWGTLVVWQAAPNMGANMFWTFAYFLVVSFFIAYLSTIVLVPAEGFMTVFRFISTAGILAYCCAGIPGSIWFKTKVFNNILDGIAYALLTGLVFALLWPST